MAFRGLRVTRWIAPLAALILLPLVCVRAAQPAAAAAACASAPYGVNRAAPGTGRTVALTFDDGPGSDTVRVMSLLSAAHVTATFFNLGVNEAANPAIVRAQRAGGFALGGHTWSHRSLQYLGSAEQAGEIDRERSAQAAATGAYPCLLRTPYGNYDSTTLALARQRGMAVWYWSVDTEDWKATGSTSQYWVDRIRSRAVAGASQEHPVILMHTIGSGSGATLAALPGIISYYRSHGYRFVDLFGNTGPPTVSSLSPSSGSTTGGTRVAVSGTNLRRVRAVYFGTAAGTSLHVVSPTRLYVTAPRHPSGAVVVKVVTTHGTTRSVAGSRYSYVPPPSVSSVSPGSGPSDGGVRVALGGANFQRVRYVTFGTYRGGSVHVVSPTRLYVTAPAHPAGTVNVRVVTAYGTSALRTTARFTFVVPPPLTTPPGTP